MNNDDLKAELEVLRADATPAGAIEVLPPMLLAEAEVIYRAAARRLKRKTDAVSLRDGEMLEVVLAHRGYDDEHPLEHAALALARHRVDTAGTVSEAHMCSLLGLTANGAQRDRVPDVVRYAVAMADANRPKEWTTKVAHDEGGMMLNTKGRPDVEEQTNWRIAANACGVAMSFDEFAGVEMITIDGRTEEFHDKHVKRLRVEFADRFDCKPPKGEFFDFLEDAASLSPYHPVKDYLDALAKPDVAGYFEPGYAGPRLAEEWLVRFGGAEDTPYVRAVSRLTLVAMVRRIRQPGCKFDQMLVLESPTQGTSKSSMLAALMPNPDWFSDEYDPTWDPKTLIEQSRGIWLFESGELRGLSRGDQGKIKQTLSRKRDRSRLAYERKTTGVKRQSLQIGTTNEEQYLRDSTGNRRYWPVRVVEFDLVAFASVRDSMWAEANALEASGMSLTLPRPLWSVAEIEQRKRLVTGRVADALQTFLDGVEGCVLHAELQDVIAARLGRANGLSDADYRDFTEWLKPSVSGWYPDKQRWPGYASGQRCYSRGDARHKTRYRVLMQPTGSKLLPLDSGAAKTVH